MLYPTELQAHTLYLLACKDMVSQALLLLQ